MESAVVTLADALAASPLLYPLALEPSADAVRFVRLTEADYAAASFLDGRLLTPSTPTAAVPWAEVRPAAAGLPVRCHFIFHISHVGSTLLSRLLGQHPALFSLREPAILRTLAEGHRTLGRPEGLWPRDEFESRLGIFLGIWSRTFHPQQTAVIKATSFVSEMAEHLLARVPTARAVLMVVTPEVFLTALLGGAISDVTDQADRRLDRLHRRLGAAHWKLTDLSPGEQVAMSWLCETTALEAAARRFPDRILWLDFDRFLAAPADGLGQTLSHLGVASDTAIVQDLVAGPAMRQYAKAPVYEFDARHRDQRLRQAAVQHGAEVRRGLDWLAAARTVAAGHVTAPPL